ncbi:MAG TPA: protein-glutamate O-methyltransferase CheR [Fontimonas sp.]
MRPSDPEMAELVQVLKTSHGYDFSDYAPASLRRRALALVDHYGLPDIASLSERIRSDRSLIGEVIGRLSVPVSEFFRDPEVFAVLRQDVLAVLASYPRINIWQSGCAHGEEVYSLAILLSEAGLYERARIYATDISDKALDAAREGIYSARELNNYAANYLKAGGRGTLSDYFHARYGHIKLDDELKRNVVFARHNLVSDAAFCEAHLVLCRNVLIYFQPPLQRRAIGLFADSLVRGGYLCLGTKESLLRSDGAERFELVNRPASLYRRRMDAHA